MSRSAESARKRREQGLCWYCSNPAEPNASLCKTHLLRNRQKARERKGYKPHASGGKGRKPIEILNQELQQQQQ